MYRSHWRSVQPCSSLLFLSPSDSATAINSLTIACSPPLLSASSASWSGRPSRFHSEKDASIGRPSRVLLVQYLSSGVVETGWRMSELPDVPRVVSRLVFCSVTLFPHRSQRWVREQTSSTGHSVGSLRPLAAHPGQVRVPLSLCSPGKSFKAACASLFTNMRDAHNPGRLLLPPLPRTEIRSSTLAAPLPPLMSLSGAAKGVKASAGSSETGLLSAGSAATATTAAASSSFSPTSMSRCFTSMRLLVTKCAPPCHTL
mmetsp:Transcript_51183/g.101855  ORF Transcript_51183/g.101855 Transcript_51183/m.101855 type:complete len:258 (+) Transcript_51183:918-1691(+)